MSGAISISDVSSFFSQSEEHKALIRTVSPHWLYAAVAAADDDEDDGDDDDVFLSESFHGSSRESVSSKCVFYASEFAPGDHFPGL